MKIFLIILKYILLCSFLVYYGVYQYNKGYKKGYDDGKRS